MTDLLAGPTATTRSGATRSPVGQRLRHRADAALGVAGELLLGARCQGCGTPAVGVCPGCRESLVRRDPVPVLPQPCPDDFPLTLAASWYDPILRQLISAHKDRQAWLLTGILGDRLAVAVRAVLTELADLGAPGPQEVPGADPAVPVARPVVLVPVPSSSAAVRRRGRDATLAIARRAADRLGPGVTAVGALRQSRRLADQSGLGAAERAANVDGGFAVRKGRRRALEGVTVIVVDDLSTTGSSLLEAGRALRRAGIQATGAATVAATRRRRPPQAAVGRP